MLEKFKAFYAVFQAGKSVSDPAKWKGHQISANAIAALLFAIVQLAKAFGYDFNVDMQTCADIAIGLLALANVGFTLATSKHIGLPAGEVRKAKQAVPSDEQDGAEEPAEVQAEVESDVRQGAVHSAIDDDVRTRAIEWAREHSATNNLQNDA